GVWQQDVAISPATAAHIPSVTAGGRGTRCRHGRDSEGAPHGEGRPTRRGAPHPPRGPPHGEGHPTRRGAPPPPRGDPPGGAPHTARGTPPAEGHPTRRGAPHPVVERPCGSCAAAQAFGAVIDRTSRAESSCSSVSSPRST